MVIYDLFIKGIKKGRYLCRKKYVGNAITNEMESEKTKYKVNG